MLASIPVGDGPWDVTTGFGLVWVVNRFDGTVTRIDPRSGRVVGDPIDVGSQPSAIAAGLCGIWVTNFADDTVTLIDPFTGAVVGDPIPVGDRPDAIAVGEGAVWVASVGGAVTRIDPEQGANRERDLLRFAGQPAIRDAQDPIAVQLKRSVPSPVPLEGRTGAMSVVPVQLHDEPVIRPCHVDLHAGQEQVWSGPRQARIRHRSRKRRSSSDRVMPSGL